MTERVIQIDLGVTWSPNEPNAVLVSTDVGRGVLALNPHHDDEDQSTVVLLATRACAATMGPPNDEGISGHRLYASGLDRIVWAGEVLDSTWIQDLEQRSGVHPRHNADDYRNIRHFILPLKDSVVEILSRELRVRRIAMPPADAALAVLTAE